MPQHVYFSRNAPVYDRRHGATISPELAGALASAARLEPADLVLDVGAGTGRVAIPLADRGCRIVAIDLALPMLQQLRSKAAPRPIWIAAGSGEGLPCLPRRFNAVILARLLYLIPDWRLLLREAFDALVPGGSLLHEWGNGSQVEPWVQIREHARALFERAGIEQPFHPGARSEDDIHVYLTELGFVRTAEVPAGPGPQLTLRSFVERIVTGEFSYTWNLPQDVQQRCLPELQAWCERTYDLDQTFSMPAELHWAVYRKGQ